MIRNDRMTKSKTLATWIALIGGSIGLHRFYLHGFRDPWGWMFPVPTMVGLYGVRRMQEFGQDDQVAWVLIPLLGLMLAATMLAAIVHGLTPDERWNARHNPQGGGPRSGGLAVFGAIVGLLVGAGVLMATIAFSGQRWFEYEAQTASQTSR